MLTAYQTSTARLLQNPAAPNPLYAPADLTSYINQARGQLAGEAECIRFIGTLALAQGTSVYNFSSITLTGATGIQGVLNVRQILRVVLSLVTIVNVLGQVVPVFNNTGQLVVIMNNSGFSWMRPRSFEWFTFYQLNNPTRNVGPPTEWSQYAQGAAPQPAFQIMGGSIYVDPMPDQTYGLWLDCVCYPVPLVDDTTPEAIPYLWTDAVPYYAAYLALLASQSTARQADADRMFARYTEFVNRARRFATPSVLPGSYPQNPSPVIANQLGLRAPAGGGG